MPSHCCPHYRPEQFVEQDPRRSESTSVLRDDADDVHNTRSQRNRSIDANIEVRVLLSWRERNFGREGYCWGVARRCVVKMCEAVI